ncbi:axin interactor, dorsalization-associated protein A-like isoform X2 [Apostichopus japonicus]
MADPSKLFGEWQACLMKGVDCDSWGLLVEAVEEYQKLSRQVMYEVGHSSTLTNKQKQTLNKIAACLELRAQTLQKPQDREGISLDELKRLESSLISLQNNAACEFPVDFSINPLMTQRLNIQRGNFEIDLEGDEIDGQQVRDDSDEDEDDKTSRAESRLQDLRVSHASIKPAGTLLPRIPPEAGKTNLTIRIDKLGLKDLFTYLDPFLVVLVKDKTGIDVTRSQDTPVSTEREDPYILFGVNVEIQKPLENLPPGSAIFFEFKHYKLKKRAISTKCYAFLEMDEMKPGPLVIELYKKPTDYRRKKLSLLTNKTLYLHLHLTLQRS